MYTLLKISVERLMTTCLAYTKLAKIIGVNANKTKCNLAAHDEINKCTE